MEILGTLRFDNKRIGAVLPKPWVLKTLDTLLRESEPTTGHGRIEWSLPLRHPDHMKKVVLFSDSSIFIHTIEDSAADKKEE